MRSQERVRAPIGLALILAGLTTGVTLPAHSGVSFCGPGLDRSRMEAAPSSSVHLRETYGRLPLAFEPNRGQTDPRVRYLARGSGYTLFLRETEAVLAFRRGSLSPSVGAPRAPDDVLRLQLIGSNPAARVRGDDPLPGRSHYFVGDDSKAWRANLPGYARVRIAEVYPGVSLIYYGNQRELEYDFEVAPGADPNRIAMRFAGARALRVDGAGDLRVRLPGGTVRWRRPFAYQERDGAREAVPVRYAIERGRRVRFMLGAYDRERPLVIDPVLSYATYLGGTGNDQATKIAVDAQGHAYVTGVTASTGFPTGSAAQPAPGGGSTDAFVTKLDPTGSALLYSTFLGGSGSENLGTFVGAVAVDAAGNAYVAGRTDSLNFPTVNALQATRRGDADAFVAKLSPDGSALLYATYLGGAGTGTAGQDFATGIAVDAFGHVYVTGRTDSGSFPVTPGAHDTVLNGTDAFVAKIDPTLAGAASLLYATYLGGSGVDRAGDIAVDAEGNACVVGFTTSTDFPTVNAAQPTYAGGFGDAFVSKLNANGSALLYATYLGSGGSESSSTGGGIAVDGAGRIAVTGSTNGANFPTTANAFDRSVFGIDAFVALIDPALSGPASLQYATVLGGSLAEEGFDVAFDAAGRIHVAGRTASSDLPVVQPIQATFAGGTGSDGFVAVIDPSLSGAASLPFCTYLGGGQNEYALGIAVDALGSAYVAGFTKSADFPSTAGAFSATANGFDDAFVVKISHVSTADLALTQSATPDPILTGRNLTFTLTLRNDGPGVATDVRVTDTLPATTRFVSCEAGGGLCGGSGNTRTVSFPSLAPGATVTITLVAAVNGDVADGTVIENSAAVDAVTQDPATGNNAASIAVTAHNPPPSIVVPAEIVCSTDPGQATAVVVFPDPEVEDNCPGATLICSPASGSLFPVGITTVTCTATDSGGASATATFTVRVIDTEPPVIDSLPDLTVTQESAYGAVVYYTPTATDNSPGVTVAGNPEPGSVFPPGTTTVACTATDASGNQASCSFKVTVVPPPSTQRAGVVGVGVLPARGGRASFGFVAISHSGVAVFGHVQYHDPVARRTLRSTRITALVVSGARARLFGHAIVNGTYACHFVIDVEDRGGRGNRFSIQTSDGYAAGAEIIGGSVHVRR